MLQDKDAMKGEWELARVKAVKPNRDDKVRDVIVQYKIQRPEQVHES